VHNPLCETIQRSVSGTPAVDPQKRFTRTIEGGGEVLRATDGRTGTDLSGALIDVSRTTPFTFHEPQRYANLGLDPRSLGNRSSIAVALAMITFYQILNFGTAVIALLVTMILIAYAQSPTDPPPALNHAIYPSVFGTFLLFGGNYLAGMLFGLPYALGNSPSQQVLHFLLIFPNNIASLCILLSALMYIQGNKFNLKNAILGSVIGVVIFLIWATIASFAADLNNIYVTLLLFTPVVLFSMVAHLALGWAFFARWFGLDGFIFLAITIVYSLVEMAGFLLFILGKPGEFANALVLILRIILAVGFIALICSSNNPAIEINSPRYYPQATVIPKYQLTKLPSIVATMLAALMAILTQIEKICNLLGLDVCR
jgi:hypothetical protein